LSSSSVYVLQLVGGAGSVAGQQQISNTYTELRDKDVSKADIVVITILKVEGWLGCWSTTN